MTQENFEKTMSLITGVVDYAEFRNVNMVIEAVIEKISLKQEIFINLEKICPPHCILASNTSMIDLNLIGAKNTCSRPYNRGTFFQSSARDATP